MSASCTLCLTDGFLQTHCSLHANTAITVWMVKARISQPPELQIIAFLSSQAPPPPSPLPPSSRRSDGRYGSWMPERRFHVWPEIRKPPVLKSGIFFRDFHFVFSSYSSLFVFFLDHKKWAEREPAILESYQIQLESDEINKLKLKDEKGKYSIKSTN